MRAKTEANGCRDVVLRGPQHRATSATDRRLACSLPLWGKIGLHAAPPGVSFQNKKYICNLLPDAHPSAQKRRQTAASLLCYGARNIAPPQPQLGAYRLHAVRSAHMGQSRPARRIPWCYFPKQKIYLGFTIRCAPTRVKTEANGRLYVVLRGPQHCATSATARRLPCSLPSLGKIGLHSAFPAHIF